MILINPSFSQFEKTNLIEIFAKILGHFIFNLIPGFTVVPDAPSFIGLDLGLGLGFDVKLFFVLFLIPVNLYLVLKHNKEEGNKVNSLQSGPGGKDPKK